MTPQTTSGVTEMICATHSRAGSDWCSIGQLSAKYGMSQPTIRTMCDNGLPHYVTLGLHRRVSEKDFRIFLGLDQPTDTTLPRVCIVCRVSTPSQAKPRTDGPDAQSDLDRQVDRCRKYVSDRWGTNCILEENIRVTSGLNFNHPQIIQFTLNLVQKKYDYVIISYKDRLARSSFDLFMNLAKQSGTEIICVEQTDDPTFTESLVEDLIALCTVAACKHNSAKAAKNSTIHVEQETLLAIYGQHRQGMSYSDIATWCAANHIVGNKNEPLSPAKIHQLLTRNQKVLEQLLPATGTNMVETFISTHLHPQDGNVIKQMDIYDVYTAWCGKNETVPVSVKKLGVAIRASGIESVKSHGGCKCYRGVALRNN